MTPSKGMAELTGLAQLVLDRNLAELRATALARNETLRLIAELDHAASDGADSGSIAALQAAQVHLLWAAEMRARLVARLDGQTVLWQSRRAAASEALGRHQALTELSQISR